MDTRRLTTTGLGVVTALSFAVVGCTQTGAGSVPGASATPTTTAASTAQTSAADALTGAAEKLNDDTVKVTMDMAGMKANGSMDPVANKAMMTMDVTTSGQTLKIDIVSLDKDAYLKVTGLPNVQNKWMHVDAAKLAGGNFDIMPQGDPAGANNLVKSVVDVQREGDLGFRGTIDLTRSPSVDKAAVTALGEKAKAVPFTATVDDHGRLSTLSVQMGTVVPSLGTLTTTYSDFGAPVTVAKPAASETVEAPDSLLKLLAG